MSGDVAAAYRNVCTHSECVHRFAGHIPEDNTITPQTWDSARSPGAPSHPHLPFQSRELELISESKECKTNHFDINYRELLACALAIHAWARNGETSTAPLDLSTSIFALTAPRRSLGRRKRMSTRNSPRKYSSVFSDTRIGLAHPGSANTAADVGSRRWERAKYADMFDNLTHSWGRAPLPASMSSRLLFKLYAEILITESGGRACAVDGDSSTSP
ncbi:hypothetical protein GQ600_24012 [Phytophthora cactorum]|nr:hypothetical protein GQ600_24012 [Phytophthora cactorum]